MEKSRKMRSTTESSSGKRCTCTPAPLRRPAGVREGGGPENEDEYEEEEAMAEVRYEVQSARG